MLTDIAARPALGSATHGPHIFDMRQPQGGPRFHPRGEHPATWRLRAQRRALLEQRERVRVQNQKLAPVAFDMECLDFCLEYVERELAEFEAGEDFAKLRAWEYIRARVQRERVRCGG